MDDRDTHDWHRTGKRGSWEYEYSTIRVCSRCKLLTMHTPAGDGWGPGRPKYYRDGAEVPSEPCPKRKDRVK